MVSCCLTSAENLKIVQYFQTRPSKIDRVTNAKGGCILRRMQTGEQKLPVKDMNIFDTQGCSVSDVKVARKILRCSFG